MSVERALLLTVKEYNPSSALKPYVNIVDNEVQGLLTRIVPFNLRPTVDRIGVRPTR